VYQQVFEEAAVDCGRALTTWSESRAQKPRGRQVRFPRFKTKSERAQSFRLRNKRSKTGRQAIRVGEQHPRSVTLPGIGTLRVHDNTRQLRRLIAKDRAKILFATISRRGDRWWLSLNVQAEDIHPNHRHCPRRPDDGSGWVGVDRGLSALVVAATADGREVARIDNPPKALARGIRQQRRLAKALSRKKKGSKNRQQSAARLGRHHHRVRNIRQHFLHQVSNQLVKTHDRLVLEDLNIAGMLRNHNLARAISDAGWAEFARQLRYKQGWRHGEVAVADRWYPSSRRCCECGAINRHLTLAQRVFTCPHGHRADRDLNAAVNLAAWGVSQAREPEARAPVTNARRRDGAGQHTARVGETVPEDAGTNRSAAGAA
jgi:putative transposase